MKKHHPGEVMRPAFPRAGRSLEAKGAPPRWERTPPARARPHVSKTLQRTNLHRLLFLTNIYYFF